MKKIISCLALIFSAGFLFAYNSSDIQIYTLENGLILYFLPDTTTATVRMELNIKAGTSRQTPENGGLMALYAGLAGLELTPDWVKTEKTSAPSQTEKVLIQMASYFKPLQVSDRELSDRYESLRNGINEFSSSTAGFINSAIDSRVFADNPWTQESGVNPQSLKDRSPAQLRTELNKIHNLYYQPSQAFLYISGNITDSSVLALAEKYFGKSTIIFSPGAQKSHYSENISPVHKNSKNPESRKYVLINDGLSKDLTQIVLQYPDFSSREAELLSTAFNSSSSEFKRLLLKQKNLAIRAPDYIDVSAAFVNNRTRLIVQAICEKSKASPAVQGELFLQMTQEQNRLLEEEKDVVIKSMKTGFTVVSDNSTLLMKNLAIFNQTNPLPEESLFNKNLTIEKIDVSRLNEKFIHASPFVFVLCNSEIYNRYSKEFKKFGYLPVTEKNGPWYKLPQHSSLTTETKRTLNSSPDEDIALSAERFIQTNKSQFSSFALSNKIPVTVKYSPSSKTASIGLSIDGGELLFSEQDAGMASILVNCLASVIQWQLPEATVTAWTGSQYSLLTVTCSTDQVEQSIKAIASSIIFGDISPALADAVSYDLRTQWRIKTGAPDFQLLCEAIRTIYSQPFTNLYQDTKDKPVQMEFLQIAQAYPLILDATRFNLVITGGLEESESLKTLLENTFGSLGTTKVTGSINSKVEKKPLPAKTKRIQLRHQFFTDISKDKAGPRPAVLIPTTDFSDPLLYMFESPDLTSTDCALFNALLLEAGDRLQKKLIKAGNPEQIVKVSLPDSDLPYGQIVVTKIKHTSQTDSLYSQVVAELEEDLKKLINKDTTGFIETEKDPLLADIEDKWILRELDKTWDNPGTVALIQRGKASGNSCLYLDSYEAVSKATAEDYYIICKSFLPELPVLRIYSKDSSR